MHLLGIGLSKYIDPQNIIKTIDDIHLQGGLAIIAHPSRNNYFIPPEIVEMLDGLEVWNAAYDSRYLPRAKSLRTFNSLRKKNASLLAFCGLDMHGFGSFREMTLVLDGQCHARENYVSFLKAGQFKGRGKILTLSPKKNIGIVFQLAVVVGHYLLDLADSIYWAIKWLKKNYK